MNRIRPLLAALPLLLQLFLLPAFLSAEVPEERKAVARRVFDEIFNQGRFEVASEIYAPEFVNHGVRRDVGLKEDQAAARAWKEAAPDLRMTVQRMMAEGELVTVLWEGTGTHTGTWNGLPATGKLLSVRGITIWRIQGGRIREEWSSFDEAGILLQLGALVPAKQP